MQGHIYKGPDIMERFGVSHSYSGCDGKKYSEYVFVYNGYDDIYRGWDLINTVRVISSIEWMWWQKECWYNVKYSGCDVFKMMIWFNKVSM